MTLTLTPAEIHKAKLEAMARVFTRANRILSAEDIVCTVADDFYNPAPAWSDGRTVTFNANQIHNIATLEDIVQVTGFNYHELAHILYTPRKGTKVVVEVLNQGWRDSFNILEDQRIETFLTSVYPATIPYFVSTFTRYCAANPADWELNFLIMYGRRYLPVDMRETFQLKFKHQKYVKQLSKIIDQYRKLAFPVDTAIALELIEKFHNLLIKMGIIKVNDPHGHSCGSRPEISVGRSAPLSEQQDTADLSDELDEELEERDEEERESKDALGSTDGDEESDDSEDADGTSDSDSDEDAEEADEDTDSFGNSNVDEDADSDDSDSTSGHADGAGSGKDDAEFTATTDADIMKMLAEQAAKILNNADVLADAKEKQAAIVDGDGEVSVALDKRRFFEQTVTQEEILNADDFAYELKQLRTDADPYWEKRNSSGRVNIDSVIRGTDYTEAFDEFREGQIDSTDIEAVILLDISSSMSYRMGDASKAMWTIKSAMESIDAHVTVLAFNSNAYLLYDKDENVERDNYRVFASEGNTNPTIAIQQSLKVFNSSTRGNKICFFITDGSWDGEYQCDEMIQDMNNNGILTAIAYIEGSSYGYLYGNSDRQPSNMHNCQYGKVVYQPSQLVDMAREISSRSFANH
jgi:hypothetical protein